MSTVNRLKKVSQNESLAAVSRLTEVCWLSEATDRTFWALPSPQTAGLLVASPSCPSRAAAASPTACCKLHWRRDELLPSTGRKQSLLWVWQRTLSCWWYPQKVLPCLHFVSSDAFWGCRSPQMPVGSCLCCCWVDRPVLAGSFPMRSSKLP